MFLTDCSEVQENKECVNLVIIKGFGGKMSYYTSGGISVFRQTRGKLIFAAHYNKKPGHFQIFHETIEKILIKQFIFI